MSDTAEARREYNARRYYKHRDRILAEMRDRHRRGADAKRSENPELFAPRPCVQCGTTIERPVHRRHRFCCTTCSDSFHNGARTAEHKRRSRLRVKYGLTLEDFDLLLASQAHCCAICGVDKPGFHGWAVDHCHERGRVRGILCSTCNTGIGQMKDDPDRLRAAADYLEAACSRP